MSAAGREDLHRILKAVIADLERDGFAAEQIGAAMTVLGLRLTFGEERVDVLHVLNIARTAIRNPRFSE